MQTSPGLKVADILTLMPLITRETPKFLETFLTLEFLQLLAAQLLILCLRLDQLTETRLGILLTILLKSLQTGVLESSFDRIVHAS